MQVFFDQTLIFIIIANLLMASISIIGVITSFINKHLLKEILIFFVSLSAGTLIGGSIFHLIPESYEEIGFLYTAGTLAISIFVFYLIEKVLHWHHHHEVNDKHTMGIMNLFADSVHNFLDGIVIAGTFLTSIPIGISTTFSVLLHEIPQELGDFGVLLHSGFSVKKILIANLLVSLVSLTGGILGYYFFNLFFGFTGYITAFAAGGFIYIATTDLIPEIKKEAKEHKLWFAIICFLLGFGLMFILKD